jgi:hypothetical protein
MRSITWPGFGSSGSSTSAPLLTALAALLASHRYLWKRILVGGALRAAIFRNAVIMSCAQCPAQKCGHKQL